MKGEAREKQVKIKDLYDCEYAEQDWYPLPKWYNQLIDKTTEEITPGDVARMLRQEVLPDLAMTKAIEFLRENPFAGELYEGEILTAIAGRETSLLAPYVEELKDILRDALEKITVCEWSYDGEAEELKEIVDSVARKILR